MTLEETLKKESPSRSGSSVQTSDSGELECPMCNSNDIVTSNIRDVAFSIHYIDNIADFYCNTCTNHWQGQYGYKGVA